MSSYLDEVKEEIRPYLAQYNLKILPRGKSSFSLIKNGQIYMTIRDTGDNVEISFQGKRFMYDKFYTKPPHLAQVILNVLEAQHRKPGEGEEAK